MKILSSLLVILAAMFTVSLAQSVEKAGAGKTSAAAAESELKDFFNEYAEDLRQSRREAIADRYDPRGWFSLGNGAKSFLNSEQTRDRYLKQWTAPKSFAWRDLAYDVLSPTSAAVTGVFDIEFANGQKATYSYSASLVKVAGKWKIRVEDESTNTVGYTTKTISGDRNTPGLWKYTLTAQPGASIAAHRHTAAMKITVKSGRKFILMGDLNSSKVQIFETGSTFVIPSNTWHVEWWEDETVEEIEMTAPTRTERATPATPRS